MQIERLNVDKEKARELWQKYQTHRVYQTPADAEIATIYQKIAQGKTVIRALESIRNAGLNEEGLPKLAIARADQQKCYWHPRTNANEPHAWFSSANWYGDAEKHNASRSKHIRLDWPGLTEPKQKGRWQYEAIVPLIPVHLRPRRGVENYHILWEAEWTKRYPVDPYLLRRFGGDAWLVVAAWDLTDVERAVMSARIRT
jgi:hypothetical protein